MRHALLKFAVERVRRVADFLEDRLEEVETQIWLREQTAVPRVPAIDPILHVPPVLERSFEDALFPLLTYKAPPL